MKRATAETQQMHLANSKCKYIVFAMFQLNQSHDCCYRKMHPESLRNGGPNLQNNVVD